MRIKLFSQFELVPVLDGSFFSAPNRRGASALFSFRFLRILPHHTTKLIKKKE
jgi:hypothetical protein